VNWLRSIRTKLILTYLAVVIPLAILLSYSFYHRYQHQVELQFESLESYANLIAGSTYGFVNNTADSIDNAGHAIIKANMSPETASSYLVTVKNHNAAIADVSYAGPSGRIVASSNTGLIGRDVSSNSYFKQAIREEDLAVTDLQKIRDKLLGFVVASAIRNDGDVTAVMIATIDASKLGEVIPNLKTNDSNIIDSKSMIIYQNDNPNLPLKLRDCKDMEIIRTALNGGIARSDNFPCPLDNEKYFLVEVPIKELGWAAGSSAKVDKAMASLVNDMKVFRTSSLIIYVLATALAFLVGTVISRPIIELSKKARKLSEENLDEPIEIKTGDEIEVLANDLDTARLKLASSFRTMNLLLEASSNLNRSLDIREVASILSESLVQLLSVDKVFVASLDQETDEIIILSVKGATGIGSDKRYTREELFESEGFKKLYELKQPFTLSAGDLHLAGQAENTTGSPKHETVLLHPLLIGNRIIGHLSLYKLGDEYAFTYSDIKLVGSIAAQAAVAIENAQLYSKERDIAETLQQALLIVPSELPGVKIDHIYEAAMSEARVGGDFYDAFELDHNRVGFVIGDVAGKGLEAATVTSMVKNTIRAFAYKGHGIAEVMSATNDTVYRQINQNLFVTAIFGVIDVESGSLEIVNAGHPDMVVRGQDGRVANITSNRNLPLGILQDANFEETKVKLSLGDTVILFTDGLVESRSSGQLFGTERVIEVIGEMRSSTPKEIITGLINSAKTFAGGNLQDDAAIISLTFKGDLTG